MAVALDAINSANQSSVANGSTQSFTLTVGPTAVLAVAFVELSLQSGVDSNVLDLANFTIGPRPFKRLPNTRKRTGFDTSIYGYTEIWYAWYPLPGVQTVSWKLNFVTSIVGNSTVTVGTYSGVLTMDASEVFGTPVLANAQLVSSLSVSDTLASGDMLVGVCANGTAPPTILTGTADKSTSGDGSTASHNTTVGHNTGTGSVTLAFNTNSGDYSGISAVKLMAGTLATEYGPFPIQGINYRAEFFLVDASGNPVIGATGLDCQVSVDGAPFAAAGNTEVEIAEGWYYCDISPSEMYSYTVIAVLKTSTAGVSPAHIRIHPIVMSESYVPGFGVEGSAGGLEEVLAFLTARFLNKVMQTSTDSMVSSSDGTYQLMSSVVSDNGTTFLRGAWG